MRQRGTRGWLVVGLLLVGCGDPPVSAEGIGSRIEEPTPPRRVVEPSLYDADGVPQPSDIDVVGLAIPRGLTPVGHAPPRTHIYDSEVPVGPLLRYFGPRLTTVDVQQLPGRTVYRDAVPRGGGAVHLDVTIRNSSAGAARVEIVERLPPAPEGVVIDAEEIRRHFEEQSRNRE
ncbi:MAG: hypothetical protein AB8I08_22495 [Sandaracinaceae bacterium]